MKRYDLSDETLQRQEELADRLNKDETLPDEVEVETEEHPEGSKRGGFVEVFYDATDRDVRVYFDPVGCTWCEYD